MKVSLATLKGYGPTTDVTVAETQFNNLLDSFRHKDDAIAIEQVTSLAEAIADPAKFVAYLESLAEEETPGVVLTVTEDGILFAPVTIPPAAVNAGAGMHRTGEGVTGSDYFLHSTTIVKKLSAATPEPPSDTVVIAHGLDHITTDSSCSVTANSQEAKGFEWAEIDAVNVIIHYAEPPMAEQGQLKYTLITNQIFS